MSKIPTAEEPIYYLETYIEKLVDASCKEIPYEGIEVDKYNLQSKILELVLHQRIEYAKLHVKAALEAASNDVRLSKNNSSVPYSEHFSERCGSWTVNKQSILNAYPENLIV